MPASSSSINSSLSRPGSSPLSSSSSSTERGVTPSIHFSRSACPAGSARSEPPNKSPSAGLASGTGSQPRQSAISRPEQTI